MLTIKRVLAGAAIAGLMFVAVTAPASAHVHVDSPDAAAGGYGKLVFRVPTESDTAHTNKVTVSLPKDTPFASVSVMPKSGWNVSMTETPLSKPTKVGDFTLSKAVTRVTWTATGAGIAPQQFDEFELSVGPFPESARKALSFDTTQAYSDGTTAAWDEATPASGKESEHPAPTLELAASSAGDHDEDSAAVEAKTVSDQTEGSGTDVLGLGTAIVALVVALGALGVALRGSRAAK